MSQTPTAQDRVTCRRSFPRPSLSYSLTNLFHPPSTSSREACAWSGAVLLLSGFNLYSSSPGHTACDLPLITGDFGRAFGGVDRSRSCWGRSVAPLVELNGRAPGGLNRSRPRWDKSVAAPYFHKVFLKLILKSEHPRHFPKSFLLFGDCSTRPRVLRRVRTPRFGANI